MPLLILTLFASCTFASAPDPEPRPERVTAVVLPYLTHMPYYIAREEGYFADEGLEVEFLRLRRSQEFMSALASGEVDVTTGMLAINELAIMASGARIRAVASLFDLSPDACPFVGVLARRELLERGDLAVRARLRELVYDTDALTPIGYQLDLLLRRHGLGIDDVKTVDIPPTAAVPVFADGTVDVMVDGEPFVSRHLGTGDAVLWASAAELTPGFPHSVVMFGPRFLDERPDLGARFATALLRGIDQFRDGKTERNLAIVEGATGQTREVLNRACWPVAPPGARLDPASTRGYQEWSVQRGLLARVLDDEELVDRRFFGGSGRTGEPEDAR